MLCSNRIVKVTLISLIIFSGVILLEYNTTFFQSYLSPSSSASNVGGLEETGVIWYTGPIKRFAVFGCSTPEPDSHRGFDYAFYLPLTVMAWRRIGFESVVLIVGQENEWKTHPILSHVLETLASLPDAKVIFIPAKVENRMMLSQTSRMFVANMKDFPGQPSDFILTTDSDLWPLRKEHFYYPCKMADRPLMLIHSQCCGLFKFNGQSYRMFPMSHIGASAAVWQEIMNGNFSTNIKANDSETILDYFQNVFGERVRQPVVFASNDWYYDQKLVSIRVHEWIDRQPLKHDSVYSASDAGLKRIDRISWNADKIKPSDFDRYFDSHLHVDGFMPDKWKTIQPLLYLMYDKKSTQYEFCDIYRTGFHEKFTKWKTSQN